MGFIGRLGIGIRKSFTGIIDFFKGSVTELKKVRWPNRKELISYTAVVVITVLLLALFFTVIDLGIAKLVDMIT
ncbi:preprotein translocase subunit SecE [Planifilum fulgidum]|jgi:preprotein translocase subunit SecE|uniref:Protein translocase subunit SecE n=1 Tax=Planifilum fulgidum TaxID=201973 RepID=A0A1I2Q5D7_9BACL|nr:preprotein translocase subunit SecE [Planifilum fulgidum]MBO2495903.1 preprotein translocase subunit SecE [Bacillota bacterium]MBO2533692.1 preprotein translocase subunit SecE [Thermoactinomycetaceae bacterium]SFG23602.1 preprotein translocase subunit SecE [Planifilum fulgidum]